MISRYVVHRHKTGRSHFDLRLVQDEILRCWSLLREPPGKRGERRLAIERESFEAKAIASTMFNEDAFGGGRVQTWDSGEVDIAAASAREIELVFKGERLNGSYQLKRMRWYPGNRWILEKRT